MDMSFQDIFRQAEQHGDTVTIGPYWCAPIDSAWAVMYDDADYPVDERFDTRQDAVDWMIVSLLDIIDGKPGRRGSNKDTWRTTLTETTYLYIDHDGGDEIVDTLESFIWHNRDSITPDEISDLRNLDVGDTIRFGGGAAGEATVARFDRHGNAAYMAETTDTEMLLKLSRDCDNRQPIA